MRLSASAASPAAVFDASSATPDLSALLAALGSGSLSGEMLSQIQSLLGTAEGAHVQAIQTEEAARKALETAVTEIRASFSGIVYALNAEAGKTTPQQTTGISIGVGATSTPTVVVYDDTRLTATFSALRNDAKKLSVGMPVEFMQDGNIYIGTVRYIASIASSGSSSIAGQADALFGVTGSGTPLTEPTLEVEIELKSHRPGDLTIGFPLDARIRVAEESSVVRVPSEAMRKELGDYFVYALSPEQTLRKVLIEIGIQSDTHAQVLSGLQEGDRVVLNPTGSLVDGQAVRVKQEQP
jgi:HlyD family secretion protein